jgi:hypothetical protein
LLACRASAKNVTRFPANGQVKSQVKVMGSDIPSLRSLLSLPHINLLPAVTRYVYLSGILHNDN